MYKVESDDEAAYQIAALPEAALPAYASLIDLVSVLHPWRGEQLRAPIPPRLCGRRTFSEGAGLGSLSDPGRSAKRRCLTCAVGSSLSSGAQAPSRSRSWELPRSSPRPPRVAGWRARLDLGRTAGRSWPPTVPGPPGPSVWPMQTRSAGSVRPDQVRGEGNRICHCATVEWSSVFLMEGLGGVSTLADNQRCSACGEDQRRDLARFCRDCGSSPKISSDQEIDEPEPGCRPRPSPGILVRPDRGTARAPAAH